MKSGNFEKFIKCSTNLLIGKVPYRYIGIQVDRDNVSTITYNITFSKKWVDFEKKNKINYHNSSYGKSIIMSVCNY